ncbi:DUF2783 domain-containing protein [Variovorax fucosicus]|uniref:DUF2783 domain-containing protein n=1 Tax=Variovorax fucosicus TaxID=3053517 RepID=UPI0025773EE0|nr:DUF2783 domain-containing protein [Variovorax sp. J22G47]MDM0056864.1 DUF2783 domain-containing protein [Variovorax sp. J22G47]
MKDSAMPHATATQLTTAANLEAPDDFYQALIEAHQGLSTQESHAFNARLILVLANHIGSLAVLREAFDAARRG